MILLFSFLGSVVNYRCSATASKWPRKYGHPPLIPEKFLHQGSCKYDKQHTFLFLCVSMWGSQQAGVFRLTRILLLLHEHNNQESYRLCVNHIELNNWTFDNKLLLMDPQKLVN